MSWDAPSIRISARFPPHAEREDYFVFSRLLPVATGADELAAAGAAGAILSGDGFGQVHADYVGDRRQPGQHVGEFLEMLLVGAVAETTRELAHFFHQPHERAGNAPRDVLLQVHVADQLLELGN